MGTKPKSGGHAKRKQGTPVLTRRVGPQKTRPPLDDAATRSRNEEREALDQRMRGIVESSRRAEMVKHVMKTCKSTIERSDAIDRTLALLQNPNPSPYKDIQSGLVIALLRLALVGRQDFLGFSERSVHRYERGESDGPASDFPSYAQKLCEEIKRQYHANARATDPGVPAVMGEDWPHSPTDKTWRSLPGLLTVAGRKFPFIPFALGHDPTLVRARAAFGPALTYNQVEFRGTANRNDSLTGQASRENQDALSLASEPTFDNGRLKLTFSRTTYNAWRRGPEYRWDEQAGAERFFDDLCRDLAGFRSRARSNIVGVGLFLYSKFSKEIIASIQTSPDTYRLRHTFAASGIARPGRKPHPFMEVSHAAHAHFGDQTDPMALQLVALGRDARMLFNQFCFVEEVDEKGEEIFFETERRLDAELLREKPQLASYSLTSADEAVELICRFCWEPAAETALLAFAERKFGGVSEAIGSLPAERWREKCHRDEWHFRGEREGLFANFSSRHENIAEAAARFYDQVVSFVTRQVPPTASDRVKVLDVGCGTGELACRLAKAGYDVEAIDVSESMLATAKERLQPLGIRTRCESAAHYMAKTSARFDICLLSQVCQHQVHDDDLGAVVAGCANVAPNVMVVEDVTQGRSTGSHTTLRGRAAIESVFDQAGFDKVEDQAGRLCDDLIAIWHFRRRRP